MPVQTMSRSFNGHTTQFNSAYMTDSELPRFADSTEPSPQFKDTRSASEGQLLHVATFPIKPNIHIQHKSQTSVSTVSSDLTERSPAATISPIGSVAASESTPGTSPDTPASTQSASFLALRGPMGATVKGAGSGELDLHRPTPIAKKARNLKNLAVNTSGPHAIGRKAATASLINPHAEVVASPIQESSGFVKPVTTTKRRPSNLGLTLKTPATGTFPPKQFFVPPTPSLVRPAPLRHFQSSPTLPTFASLDNAMKSPYLPLRRPVPFATPEGTLSEYDEVDQGHRNEFEESESRASSPHAYPDGPVCIYEPHIFLFSEPSAEVASKYDVVINVASEVKSPFLPDTSTESQSSPPVASTEHETVSAELQAKAALKLPLYRHLLWEHNTDIVPDLIHLVKDISSYERENKRVLIHCQLGVSRSASLIVAYGIFKNPTLSVQEAYNAVKARSKWISPNMNLIMQLQEFRSELLKGTGLDPSKLRSTTVQRSTKSPKDVEGLPKSAPLQPESKFEEEARLHIPNSMSSGPSSAPSGFDRLAEGEIPTFARGNFTASLDDLRSPTADFKMTIPRPKTSAAILEGIQTSPTATSILTPISLPTEALNSARSAEFAMTPVVPQLDDLDTFGLTSPRMTVFTTELPHRQLHGDTAPETRIYPQRDVDTNSSTTLGMSSVPPALNQNHGFARPSQRLPSVSETPLETETSLAATERQPQTDTSALGFEFTAEEASLQHTSLVLAPSNGPDRSSILLSPRAVEFTSNPFHDVLVAPAPQAPTQSKRTSYAIPNPADEDPRSPAAKGQSPVFRSIFDVL